MHVVAYLDANSGSMIAAAVAGGLAGVAVVFKLWWRRFTSLFMPKRRAALKAEQARAKAEAAAAQAAPAEAPDATAPTGVASDARTE